MSQGGEWEGNPGLAVVDKTSPRPVSNSFGPAPKVVRSSAASSSFSAVELVMEKQISVAWFGAARCGAVKSTSGKASHVTPFQTYHPLPKPHISEVLEGSDMYEVLPSTTL